MYVPTYKKTIYTIDLSSSGERCVWLLCVSTPALGNPVKKIYINITHLCTYVGLLL